MNNLLKKLIGENTTCDFKEFLERKQIKSWLKSVSAFANGIGGSLFFGVNDEGEIVGLDDVKTDTAFISDKIKNIIDPVPDFELKTISTEEGKIILELHVPSGSMTPYYFVNSGSRVAFIRIGDESVVANSSQLSSLVLKGRNITYDSLATEYTVKDLTFNTLATTYQQQTGLPFEIKLLRSFSLITEKGFFTNAGILFSDQCPFRHSSLYCTRWTGLHKDDAKDSREYQGNLLKLLNAGVQFVDLHNLKGWIKLPNRRLNTPDYSSRAVFEALVNAFIHRDYTELGSEVHIDIFDDRLIIYSPGGMFDGTLIQDRDLDEVSSKRRNPVLADVFAQLNYMEKRGSGLRKIRNETSLLPGFTEVKEPRFRSQATSFYTELLNNNYQRLKNDLVSDLVSDPVSDPVKLSLLQIDLLEYIKQNTNMTRPELCEKLHVSLATVRRAISLLKELNILKRVGSDKNGHWIVNDNDSIKK